MMQPSAHAALLALAAAVLWGGGDFSGGMGVKRAGGSLQAALRVVLISHFTSFCILASVASLRHDPLPHGAPLAWSLATGLAGGFSVTAFYVALAEGAMGSAAAISGLLAAAIPALISFAIEGSPGPFAIAGFALAASAIWLIAGAATGSTSRRALLLAIASGAGFGVYFVCLRMSSRAGLFWPLSGSRFGSMSVCVAGIAITSLLRKGPSATEASGAQRRTSTAEPPATRRVLNAPAMRWAFGTALFDTGGNLFFMAATRAGRLDIAAVLASLYPASTILLAAWLLHERPTLRQLLGMLLAAAAVALVTL